MPPSGSATIAALCAQLFTATPSFLYGPSGVSLRASATCELQRQVDSPHPPENSETAM